MKNTLYLAPVTFNHTGLVFEYRMIYRKTDKRTTFHKRYKNYICGDVIDTIETIAVFAKDANLIVKDKNRVILASGAAAYRFMRHLGFSKYTPA